MGVDGPWRCRYVPAERPCWKGELQVGRLVFGWATRDEEEAMSPGKFRKKPVVVEAIQLTRDSVDACRAFCGGALAGHPFVGIVIRTDRDDLLTIREGDWIIKGTRGELYPCEARTFAEIYESAEPDEPPAWKKPSDSVA